MTFPSQKAADFTNFTSKKGAWGGLAALGGAFLLIYILQLKGEWNANPQYSFGWGVPFLGAILFAKRWKDQPEAREDFPRWMVWGGIAALGLWLPVRILREANMDWRLLEWGIVGAVVALILGVLIWSGGRAQGRHFAVPVLFLLLAVPWPSQLENEVVRGLSFVVTKGTVEALRWMGIAAWSTGSVIQMPGATVGVEEACSGIRALQGSLMCAVFIGEVRRMTVGGRIFLTLLAVVIALAVNFARTLWLALAAARGGAAEVGVWHDGAGWAALLICFGVLWVVAMKLKGRRSDDAEARREPRPTLRGFHPAVVGGCVAWLVLVEVGTAAWYAGGTAREFAGMRVRMPGDAEAVALPEQVRSILRFDEGASYRRKSQDGAEWWIYNIRWDADGAGANLARYHSPEVCLPAAGFRQIEAGRVVEAGGVAFRFLEYEWLGKPVFVFASYRSAIETETIRKFEDFDLTWGKRIRSALRGERAGAQEVVQVVIAGAASAGRAEAAFRKFARDAFVIDKGA